MMSSKDEQDYENGQRYFLVHKPTFRIKMFEKLIRIIDDSYLENWSKRSKNQMIRREVGSPIVRSPPSLNFVSDIFMKRYFFPFMLAKHFLMLASVYLEFYSFQPSVLLWSVILLLRYHSICKQRYFYLLCHKWDIMCLIFNGKRTSKLLRCYIFV